MGLAAELWDGNDLVTRTEALFCRTFDVRLIHQLWVRSVVMILKGILIHEAANPIQLIHEGRALFILHRCNSFTQSPSLNTAHEAEIS